MHLIFDDEFKKKFCSGELTDIRIADIYFIIYIICIHKEIFLTFLFMAESEVSIAALKISQGELKIDNAEYQEIFLRNRAYLSNMVNVKVNKNI